MSDEDLTIHRGTGCLWTDLGFSNRAEMEVRARLAAIITDVIREKCWTPGDAARATGMDASIIRSARHGRLSELSAGDLFEVITRLGCDVGISVGPPENKRGAVLVWRADDE
jgi:predicted XRE-type DNA-binding protein